MIKNRWIVYNNSKSCIICLPGAGSTGENIARRYDFAIQKHFRPFVIGLTPQEGWYPTPNGPDDQEDAAKGVLENYPKVDEEIKRLQEKYKLERKHVAITGHSAGAVMALQLAINSEEPYGCAVIHAGAVFEPDKIPECKHPDMQIMILHNKDDNVFTYKESYLPMVEGLRAKNYNVITPKPKIGGGHKFEPDDASGFIYSKIYAYES